MVWRYPSALGHQGNLELDLNYMYRVPLWPVASLNSIKIGDYSVNNVPILDFYELVAWKLSALFDRVAGRDLFDTYFLLSREGLDFEKLRLTLIIYSAMSRKKDFREVSLKDVNFDRIEFKNRVIPLLSNQYINEIGKVNQWAEKLLDECHEKLSQLFPLRENELEFLREMDFGNIKPELITKDELLIKNIELHPALHWRLKKNKE